MKKVHQYYAASLVWRGPNADRPPILYSYQMKGKGHNPSDEGAPMDVDPTSKPNLPGSQTGGDSGKPSGVDDKEDKEMLLQILRCTGTKDCHCAKCEQKGW